MSTSHHYFAIESDLNPTRAFDIKCVRRGCKICNFLKRDTVLHSALCFLKRGNLVSHTFPHSISHVTSRALPPQQNLSTSTKIWVDLAIASKVYIRMGQILMHWIPWRVPCKMLPGQNWTQNMISKFCSLPIFQTTFFATVPNALCSSEWRTETSYG